MIRSKMLTPLFRLFAGWSALSLFAAFIFGVSTSKKTFTFGGDFPWIHNEDLVNTVAGPLTIGWKGPVGNHVGYAVFLGLAVITAGLAGLLVAFRDADPEAQAEVVATESVPLTRAPAGANYWPVITAFGAGVTVVGWVINHTVFLAGLAILVVSAVVWTFRAWADRATGDEVVNREIYHRVIDPLRIPVLAVVGIAYVVVMLSQVLKTTSREVSIGIFLGSFVIFGLIFVALAFAPRLDKSLIVGLFLFLALVLGAAGIWASIKGERFDHEKTGESGGEGTGGSSGESGKTEGGLAPAGASAPIVVQVSS